MLLRRSHPVAAPVRRRALVALAAAAAAAGFGCRSDDGPSGPPSPPPGSGTFVEPGPLPPAYPTRLAVAADGTVFVSDATLKAVLGYQGDRKAWEIKGFDRPLGLATAGRTLWVGDAGRGTVEAYDLDRRAFALAAGKGAGEFAMPNAIAVAPGGDEVLVADSLRNEVRVLAADGTPVRTIGRAGSGDGELSFPVAVAVDDARVLVADQGNRRVQVFGRDGRWEATIGRPFEGVLDSIAALRGRFSRPQGVALAGDRVLVLDSSQALVHAFDGQGTWVGFAGPRLPTTGAAHLPLFLDLAAAPGGGLLLVEPLANRFVASTADLREMP